MNEIEDLAEKVVRIEKEVTDIKTDDVHVFVSFITRNWRFLCVIMSCFAAVYEFMRHVIAGKC